MTLVLHSDLADAIRRHAEQAYPEEAAGLMLGIVETGGQRRVAQVVPLANRWEDGGRHHRYRIDPRELMAAEDRADRDGLTIVGIFHSHPDHPAQPSAFDLDQALPFYSYVITRVDGGRAFESRAWRMSDDRNRFDEETLQVDMETSGAP
jgi:proteasome lid subunit RPN8/RPN11